jgi:hypothetical protein
MECSAISNEMPVGAHALSVQAGIITTIGDTHHALVRRGDERHVARYEPATARTAQRFVVVSTFAPEQTLNAGSGHRRFLSPDDTTRLP